MVRDDFGVLILSHGRADNMMTVDTMTGCGYTGKWYIVIDNEDKQADLYYSTFGHDHVVMFDKIEKAKTTDTMDQQEKRNIVLFARNSCHEIAKNLGLKYFLVLDDDYVAFRMRYVNDDGVFTSIYVKDMDSIINETLEFLDTTGAITVAFAQTGDFIGGAGSNVFKNKLTRKVMNSFFCRTDKPFEFLGRINEDVNMYCTLGSRGELMFTFADISLEQQTTQANHGGLTDSYLDNGTYIKSFYSVMCCPSFVKVAEMGCSDRRIHHLVDWEHGVPKIISSKFKNG